MTTLEVTTDQALAWRMRRHHLDPVGSPSVTDVVRRLCGVQAQVASSAELAVRVRRSSSRAGEVARALGDGRLVKTWAMRGTLHLLTPDTGVAFLSLIAAGRSWERPAWEKHFGVSPDEIERLRRVVRDVLDGEALTREELVDRVTGRRGFRHLGEALGSGWGTLLKPLAWQGDVCHGPSRGTRVTFVLPEQASDRWPGIPEPGDAAPVAVAAYLAAHGPAAPATFAKWLAGGWFGVRQVREYFDTLGDAVAEVRVGGEPAFLLSEHLDDLAATERSGTVRLLPGFDQWVLAPGTADERVVPASRRPDVSRQAGWISPVVIVGGRVTGTWEADDGEVRVSWFAEAGRVPRTALAAEADRIAGILGTGLRLRVTVG